METYCSALLNQEKSLEELQRHLRTTEDLFRESVKRKNQQLDLLQSEVRRLKTSVGVRDEAASLQIDAALNAQAGELRRAKEALAERDQQVDKMTREVANLKAELADEKARLVAERARADEASQSKGEVARADEELTQLREELSQAQTWAEKLQTASASAEAALEARDAELAAMRQREDESHASAEQSPAANHAELAELELLRSRADEANAALAQEQEARAAAEEHALTLQEQLGEREQTMHVQRDEMSKLAEQLKAGHASAGDDGEKAKLKAQLTAKAEFLGCDASTAQFSWHRGGAVAKLLLSGSSTYMPNVDDLGHDILVRVTPIAASGKVGEAKGASTNEVALPADVKQKVQNWYDIKQHTFNNLLEGEKERQLLLHIDKVKLQDSKGSTQVKSASWAGVTMQLDPNDTLGFTLTIPDKKGKASSVALRCRQEGVRDLVALTLRCFANPASLQNVPIATPSASQASALHLAAAGQITSSKHEGGGQSPASSATTEQQSLADVEERPGQLPSAAARAAPSSNNKVKSKFSFSRASKK